MFSVAACASSRCSIHSNRDNPGGQSLRATSESATSRGWRRTNNAAGSTPSLSSTGHHNGNSRQARGSFTAHRAQSANSARSRASRSFAAALAAPLCNQSAGSGRGSFHDRPSEANSRSWIATTPACSQNPLGLSGPGCISSEPSSTPSRRSAPVTADVPLRCMPSTSIARCLPPTVSVFMDLSNVADSSITEVGKHPQMVTAPT